MKESIKRFIIKIYLKLFSLYGKWVLKIGGNLTTLVFYKLYISSIQKFPNNKLSDNHRLAVTVTKKIFDMPSIEVSSVCSEELAKLYDFALKNDWVCKKLVNYHLIHAYYYSYGINSGVFDDQAECSMSKAKEYSADVIGLNSERISELNTQIKKEKKSLQKEVKRAGSTKVEEEKLKVIAPITIDSKHFTLALTLLTTLFLISGFIYTKSFFYWFNIDVGDFYTAQDYISSSIDVISTTAITAGIGLIAALYGLSSALTEELEGNQFDSKKKKREIFWPFILIVSILGLALSVYDTGKWPSLFLYPIVFTAVFYFYFRAPFWKYIENKAPVGLVCVVLLFFFIHLGFRVKENVEKVTSGSFDSKYQVEFNKGYEKYNKMPYLTGNSSFIFVLNEASAEIIVLPRASVKLMKVGG
jgi:hypothetical protein